LSETLEAYQRRKERERKRQAVQSAEGRDIAPIPECGDDDLRQTVVESLKAFCEICFPRRFRLAWSDDHIFAIREIEDSIRNGSTFALAMPRGHGKTALAVVACLWAVLSGHNRYVVLIGADKKKASRLLANLKRDLETNEMLHWLFPEVTHPIRKLEGKGQKSHGQICNGKQTHIEWTGSQIVLATIPGRRDAAIFEVFGLQGGIRGCQYTTPDGELIRPDLFILDDPQTDKSAASDSQTDTRMELVNGAVMGLAGPDESIAGFALVTVIKKGDLADQLLDNEANPEWRGYRCKLIYDFPTNQALWEQYFSIRSDDGFMAATKFYHDNRLAMDDGAVVSWEQRYRKKRGELSAIQHAMELKHRYPATFDAEYQNEPQTETLSLDLLESSDIMKKVSGFIQGDCPPYADTLTAFIDVQGELLFWKVIAFNSESFDCWLVDYGTVPEQPQSNFTLRNARVKLSKKYPKLGLEGKIRKALWDLLTIIGQRVFPVGTSGRTQKVKAIGIDAAWGPVTQTIQSVCLEHPLNAILMPCFGRGLKASDKPMEEWQKKPGERKGNNWIVRPTEGGGRHMIYNTNYWKTFFHARLSTAIGDKGSYVLFKPRFAGQHKLISEHYRVEKPVRDPSGNGKEIDIWKLPISKPDQHYFDAAVGCFMLASACGAKLKEAMFAPKRQPSQKKLRRKTELKI
jgi:hypothetical protein